MMRVECSRLDAFLMNLETVPPESVFGKAVYADVLRDPFGANSHACMYTVTFQATAVVREDSGEYLLVVGVNCGKDYDDASKDDSGSKTAGELVQKLMGFCNGRGLAVRPGRVSE